MMTIRLSAGDAAKLTAGGEEGAALRLPSGDRKVALCFLETYR